MPRYDFRCRQCGETFEVSRPMSASGEPATCPAGHADTVKLLPTVAVGGLGGGRRADARGRRRRLLRRGLRLRLIPGEQRRPGAPRLRERRSGRAGGWPGERPATNLRGG